MSNKPRGGNTGPRFCARVGEADLEYIECVGEAVGVRWMVDVKSQESADGIEAIDGCFRLS